jgi:Flp pilus assembly protein TadG
MFEAAIVVPLLLMLLFGIIWFARAYNVYQTMTRAAREGARFAVAPSCAMCGNTPPADSEILTVVNGALAASALDPAQVTPNATPVTACSGSAPTCSTPICIRRNVLLDNTTSNPPVCGVAISFNYPFQFYVPFTTLNLTTITLSTQVQMRQE